MTEHSAEQQFTEAVAQFHVLVRRRFGILAVDAAAAEDLTQEAFARFWAQLASGTQVENTWCFLRQIMQNVGLEYLRACRRDRAQDLMHVPDQRASSPAAEVEHAEQVELVRKLVRELPREEQDLIFSWYVLELSGPEIAEAFGLPRRTALDRIYATIATLAGQMGAAKEVRP